MSGLVDRGTTCAVATDDRFIPLFAKWLALAGDLRLPSKRRRLAEAIFAYLYVWERRDHAEPGLPAMARFGLIAAAGHRRRVADDTYSFAEIVESILAAYAAERSRPMAAAKVAFRQPAWTVPIAEKLPDARIVHLIRDGRDVAASWRETYFGPRSMTVAAWRWSRSVEAWRQWGAAHPARYLEVRYEDLVGAPGLQVRRVAEFWGCETVPSDYPGEREIAMSGQPWLSALAGHVQADRAGRWRERLTDKDAREFVAVAGPLLGRLGYDFSQSSSRGASLARAAGAVATEMISPITYRRAAADLLPAALMLCAQLQLPVAGLLLHRLDNAMATIKAGEPTRSAA